MNTNIREYIDADWEAVREIYNLSQSRQMSDPGDPGVFVSIEDDPKALRLFEQSDIIVKEVGGRVVAFAGHRNNYISWLYVHPDYRGRGLGRKLLTRILEGLTGAAMLSGVTDNPAARSLYESMGFAMERIFIGDFDEYEWQAMPLLLRNKRTSDHTVGDFFWRAIHGEDE